MLYFIIAILFYRIYDAIIKFWLDVVYNVLIVHFVTL